MTPELAAIIHYAGIFFGIFFVTLGCVLVAVGLSALLESSL